MRERLLPWVERTQRGTLLGTVLLFSAGFATIGLIFVLASVIAEGIVAGRIPWRRSRVDVLLAAFILVFVIAGWLSPYRSIAVNVAVLAALTTYVAFGPLYRSLQRDKNFLRPFLLVWVIGGVGAALWGIHIHRLAQTAASTPGIPQNALGTTLQVAVPLSIGLFLASRTAWRYLVVVIVPTLAVGLALTTSRGAWIGGAFALGSFFVLVGLRHSWRAFLILLLIGALGGTYIARAHSPLIKRMGTILSLSANQDRVAMAESALAIFRDHPVIGTGFGTFSLIYPMYRMPGDPVSPNPVPFAHNIFLNMAAEGGALGLVTFTAIVVWAIVAGWQWYGASSAPQERILSAAILSAFAGMMVQQLFDGTILSVHLGAGFWFFVAILAAFKP